MKCEECKKCNTTDLKDLCLDKETRAKLLFLIEDGIKMQMDTENFLYGRGYTKEMMNSLAKGVRIHFHCLLPDRDMEELKHKNREC